MKALILQAISCSGFGLALLSFGACSSSSNGNAVTGTNDSGASSDSAAPTASCVDAGANLCTSTQACNTTVNGACVVTTVQGTGSLPEYSGGTIVDGTYFLTGVTTYGATEAAGQTHRITMTFTAGAFTVVQDSDANCTDAPGASGTTSTSGTQLTLAITCPGTDSESYSYTATATTFSYGDTPGTTGSVYIFTRQ